MRKIKDILRLRHDAGLSYRAIAQSLNIGYGTVVDYLTRAETAQITWPLPDGMAERDLAARLFPAQPVTGQRRFIEPDFSTVQHELKRKGVTKLLLWEEYRQHHPDDGYSYPQFCARYATWIGCQKRSMRQVHRAGEKLFVDYCGPTMAVVNPDTGEIRNAQIFVAVLGASSYTYACAGWSQQEADWLEAHVSAFEFFGGVPQLIVPDYVARNIIRHHQFRHPHEEFEGPDVGANPVWQRLAPGGFGIGVVGGPQDRHKDLRLMDLSGGAINDRCGLAGIIHKELLPGPVVLAHHQVQLALPGPVVLAEPAVLAPLQVCLPVRLPEQDFPKKTMEMAATPLHPGAVRFYKEMGIEIPKHLLPGKD